MPWLVPKANKSEEPDGAAAEVWTSILRFPPCPRIIVGISIFKIISSVILKDMQQLVPGLDEIGIFMIRVG